MSLGKRILPLNLGSNMLILRNKMFDPEFQVNTSFLTAQAMGGLLKKFCIAVGRWLRNFVPLVSGLVDRVVCSEGRC